MAILNMKEFASLVGISYDTVKKNAQRGNIIKGTNGKIDTENPTNKLFIDEKKVINSLSPTKYKKDDEENPTKKSKVSVEKPIPLTKIQKEYEEIELRSKRAKMDLDERTSELRRIQLEKAAGNLLPVDLVERVLVINLQSIIKSFDTELENISNVLVERFGGSRNDLVEITKEQRDILGRIIAKAKKDAEFEIENAVNDFQDNRGRGERKT